MAGPYGWPVSYAEDFNCLVLETMALDDKAVYEQMAGEYLRNWTQLRYGLIERLYRPYSDRTGRPSTFEGRGPYGAFIQSGWPWPEKRYSFELPLMPPVASVTEVLIDGEVLDPASYRLDNGAVLVRTDGKVWPWRQDLELPLTAANTWQVTFDQGIPVPIGGQISAGILACEFAKAAVGDQTCRLPNRMQAVSRQGVTMTVVDDFSGIEKGKTGIWFIDSWVSSVMEPPRASAVYSADLRRPRHRGSP